jgi:CspA family cold shock protein
MNTHSKVAFSAFAPASLKMLNNSGDWGIMATGTVKSFSRSKGYGFIRTDSSDKEVFVHLSAVKKAGLADLRKGQKVKFEIFDNGGKAAAKNLCVNRTIQNTAGHKLVAIQNGNTPDARCKMSSKNARSLNGKRTPISRAALELAIAETIRASDPQCQGLVGVIVERIVPKSAGDANWIVKGVKYGKAERARCSVALSNCVEEGQREFEISD